MYLCYRNLHFVSHLQNSIHPNVQTGTSSQGNPLPDLSGKAIPALLALVDEAILKKAARGDVAAAKLCYQRFDR